MRTHAVLITLLYLGWRMEVGSNSENDDRTQASFASRTPSDWQDVWHRERHRKCYHDLVSHMDWVCRNDIYQIPMRRSLPSQRVNGANLINRDLTQGRFTSAWNNNNVFLTAQQAASMLRSKVGYLQRQRKKRGIMDECCSDNGCSWEEYAEYCPTNRRIRTRNL